MQHMKNTMLLMTVAIALSVYACKGKNQSATDSSDSSTVATIPQDTTPAPAQVQISADDSLTTKLNDAVKDYPGVTASVSNGEVTLTGDVSRNNLPKVMQAVYSLHPKKVNNKLTIK